MRNKDKKNDKPAFESILLNLFSIHPISNDYPLNSLVTNSSLNFFFFDPT